MKLFIIIFLNIIFFIPSAYLFSQTTNEPVTPKEIVEKYLTLYNDRKFSERYDYLAAISKANVSKDEYINFYKDVYESDYRIYDIKVSEIETETNQSRYKRIKVDNYMETKGERYKQRDYYTFINENGKWKIVWTRLMKNLADEKNKIADYKKAIELYNNIIDINPYDGFSYNRIAWCYYLDETVDKETKKKEMFNYTKKAIFYEPDIAEYYRTMSIYYMLEGLDKLQLEYITKAIDLVLNESQKGIYYNDLAWYYLEQQDYSKSINYINQAIKIDSNDTYNFYLLGKIYHYNNQDENAKDAFKKALLLKPLPDYLQAPLYAWYAYICYELHEIEESKVYMLKSLELDPTCTIFKKFYELFLK